MKLNIGETIKRMRKEKEITQEEFSQVLGVSCQSVSRWENGSCYPDIELVPTIASFFGVSTDKLMGVDEITEMENVEKYLERFQLSISRGEIDKCIAVAREGVGEYPNNYILLDKLMYALFVAGDDDGNIPEWKENMERYDSEITALGEKIMKYCPDQSIRLAATARLAFNHCLHGRKEIGRKIYETLCERFDITPENAVFLDDNAKNTKAAQEFGLHAITVENKEQTDRDLHALGVTW